MDLPKTKRTIGGLEFEARADLPVGKLYMHPETMMHSFSFVLLVSLEFISRKWFRTKQVTDDFYKFTFIELWVVIWHGKIRAVRM